MLSPPKPLDEIQPNLVCELLTYKGPATAKLFLDPPPGARGGIKRSNIIKFQLQSQFQRFLYQTLCVFSQIKDIQHIKQDFHSSTRDFGALGGGGGGPGGQKFFFFEHGHVAYQIIKLTGIASRTECN